MTRSISVFVVIGLMVFEMGCRESESPPLTTSPAPFSDSIPKVMDPVDTSLVELVVLPFPKREEMAKNRTEIFNMQLSAPYFDWKSPTSGGAAHITADDEILVYQSVWDFDRNANGHMQRVPDDQLRLALEGIPSGSLSRGILITSECNLSKSRSIEKLLDLLYLPGYQIYYLKKKSASQ